MRSKSFAVLFPISNNKAGVHMDSNDLKEFQNMQFAIWNKKNAFLQWLHKFHENGKNEDEKLLVKLFVQNHEQENKQEKALWAPTSFC